MENADMVASNETSKPDLDGREIGRLLTEPFEEKVIEWRIGRQGIRSQNGAQVPWAMALAYVTARAIMDRLDAVVGPGNWRNEYAKGPEGGVLCGLSIRINGEWITKWDGADNTDIEAVKGGLSDATKRAAVQWGIGRYLYQLPEQFVEFADNGDNRTKIGDTWYRWHTPKLPAWAKPETAPVVTKLGDTPTPAATAPAANGNGNTAAKAPTQASKPTPAQSRTTTTTSAQAAAHKAAVERQANAAIGGGSNVVGMFNGDWRAVEIPFGKQKGKRLGDLPVKSLQWWIENWQPQPFNGRPPGTKELMLRAALDAAAGAGDPRPEVHEDVRNERGQACMREDNRNPVEDEQDVPF